jgi:serine/threonine protein kinase
MPEVVLAIAAVLALILLAGWASRTDFLLHVAGVDPRYIQTVPDRVRYTSMGAIVLLTATAATASLTTALFLVFPRHSWLGYLPVGLLWGTIVLNFDRWIVSSIDYGPLTAGEAERSQRSRSASKVVFFSVRFIMAALVGVVISEPIVLTIFGPEISQQLTVQHVADTSQQTAQLNAAEKQQAAVLKGPLNSARSALAAATRKATAEHKIYICELTGNCHLPPGEVTGIAGQGPQTAQDHAALQRDLRAENAAQKIFNKTSANERGAAAALRKQTNGKIATATQKINADNGLLARERALGTLTRQNPGFLLRRLLVWLALMFIDLVPVLLKTFSPPTLYELLQRSAAVRAGRNALAEAAADSDHESSKRTIDRERDLEQHRAGGGTAEAAAVATATADAGWRIGQRWQIQRPLSDVPNSGRVPFVAVDAYRQYPFEVVVKIVAPPPGVAGWQAARERRHAQMEMSLPQGHIHDNIAEVLDCDVDPEHGYYIVTRLYPATLEQYLADAGNQDALTIGVVLDFAAQILAGLRAAWDLGFVHLDLKPANVALAGDGTVKLIDFGLAQQYQQVNGGNNTTTAARFTMFYAPPEQMERRDASWISRKADLRALGAVIYRMLTGYPPMFREARALGLIDPSGRWLTGEASAYYDMTRLVRSVEPVPAGELIGCMPADLDMLVQTWLRIDPQLRSPGNPETMAERVWIESAAIFGQLRASGEAGYPAGPRMTQEPEFAELRARWRRGFPPQAAARAGTAMPANTLAEVPGDVSGMPGFTDPATLIPGGYGPGRSGPAGARR